MSIIRAAAQLDAPPRDAARAAGSDTHVRSAVRHFVVDTGYTWEVRSRVQQISAAGNRMVGPPSFGSFRDQKIGAIVK
jgi:hypothetical protein